MNIRLNANGANRVGSYTVSQLGSSTLILDSNGTPTVTKINSDVVELAIKVCNRLEIEFSTIKLAEIRPNHWMYTYGDSIPKVFHVIYDPDKQSYEWYE